MYQHPSRGVAPNVSIGAALVGQYYTVVNPTPGTGLATIAALATLADTSPFVSIITGARSVMLDYLRLINTAPGTGGTALRFAVKSDALKTQATGGSAITPVGVNRSGANAATCNVVAGPLVAAAAISPLLLSHNLLKAAIPAANDEYVVKFAGVDGTVPISSTAVLANAPPAIFGPSTTCQIHIWLPSQSAASSWEFELGLIEF